MFECDVDVVDCEGVRRDLAIVLEYCCGEEEADGNFGLRGAYEEKVEAGGCREGGKPMSGTILLKGRRSVRLKISGAAGDRGFLWGNW